MILSANKMTKNKNNFFGGFEMKKLVLMMVVFAFASTAFAGQFSDVPRTHWAYDSIQAAVDAGILQGYDGKFHGKRLLNRYQMAVITAKMLDKMGKGGAVAAPSGELKRMIANLEALTIEFADELALLNVKVSTLEDTVAELRAGKNCKTACPTTSTGDLGFTAFASFGLIMEDDQVGVTRYSGSDSMEFNMPQVSIGVDKEVDEGVYFHAQIDWDSETDGGGGSNINEAYFMVDELFGKVGAKMGAFALPFSMEHNGPFRSCNLTITPSVVNTNWEQLRPYGLEIQPVADVKPEDIQWKFGIVSATDDADAMAFALTDAPASINGSETDDGFGFYIQIAKAAPAEGGFGWNFTYFDNGGDINEGTAEVDAMQIGLSYSMENLLFLLQYADGTSTTVGDNDFTTFYFLVNYKVDEKNNITLRYDDWENDNGVTDDGDAITFAWNYKVSENSMMQLEYLTPDRGAVDINDDLFQIRYKVHF